MLRNFVNRALKRKNASVVHISPFDKDATAERNTFLKRLSEHALNLYQKKSDIKKFTELATSDPNDLSHNDLVNELAQEDEILRALSDGDLFDLFDNENFLKDLDL